MKTLSQILTDKPLGEALLPYLIEVNPIGTDKRTGQEVNNFNRIRETLKRIGIASPTHKNVLNQSCHIFFHEGKYYIVHFLLMFMFDGSESKVTIDDLKRNERVAELLETWGLCTIVNRSVKDTVGNDEERKLYGMCIVKYKDSNDWTYRAIYKMRKEAPNVGTL